MKLKIQNSICLFNIVYLILWVLTACSSNSSTHKIKSYEEEYADGTVKKECRFLGMINKNDYKHHCRLYHENGNLSQEGDFINDTIAIGWHTYYRQRGIIKARREYLSLSPGHIYLNRVIRFEINGDTDKTHSNYFQISFESDTVALGDYLVGNFNLEAPYFKDSYISVTFKNNAGEDELLPVNYSRIAQYNFNVVGKGEHELKGIIEEIEKLEQSGDTIKVRKRPLYFSKTYWVK